MLCIKGGKGKFVPVFNWALHYEDIFLSEGIVPFLILVVHGSELSASHMTALLLML
jgi:hypothetical protein